MKERTPESQCDNFSLCGVNITKDHPGLDDLLHINFLLIDIYLIIMSLSSLENLLFTIV